MRPLDRPVWESLSTYQEPLSLGSALARRFSRDVNLFASACDDSPIALAALAELVRAGEQVFLLRLPQIVLPLGCVAVKEAHGVQMVGTCSFAGAAVSNDVAVLGEEDAADMLALARLTEPGPFLERKRWDAFSEFGSTAGSQPWPANACACPATPR